ncbi:TetR family transcriptional regulator C-terminal domain-containing protein [Variovorax fucosicus]|uniref:TetR family transcriptional regulator C-terminal domain-containing protein n=1 Tax=Variovorax fucosicus TaxID=3053517 RepID=UPI002579232B|nr:TetR family transcriptional regulator C-terminal domain-containing protein [Variovorax sp. J22G47]MDM0054476.1 TetR family transcriptional regulator C-terminal domain-containing protein [Variovorax sp. J22G47]
MNVDNASTPAISAQQMPAPDGPLSRARPGRERILAAIRDAAVTEFSLHGLKGTSTQAIAARAGLTKPQLHYYIAGKEELYEELLMQVLHDWKVVFAFEDHAKDPGLVLGDYIRKKLDHAFDNPEISRIFTREVLDGGRNLDRYWPNARAWTQKKVDIINGWIARGQMRPLDARLLLMHIWAMTQSYADYALQTRVMLGLPADAPLDREPIARELVAFVLAGAGIPQA